MRTDVKIGLLGGLAVAVSLVAYFAWQSQRHQADLAGRDTSSHSQPSLMGADAGSGDTSTGGGGVVIPPTAGGTTLPATTMAGGGTAPPGATMPADFGPVTTMRWDPSLGSTTRTATTGRGTWPDTAPAHGMRDWQPMHSDVGTVGTGDLMTSGAGAAASGIYEVKAGDSFGKIAKANGTTIKAMEKANPGVDSRHLKIGQKLKLPTASGTGTGTGVGTGTGALTDTTGLGMGTGTGTATTGAATAGGSYTVKKGDTLAKIAKSVYGKESMWRRIQRANRDQVDADGNISVGLVLKLPAVVATAPR